MSGKEHEGYGTAVAHNKDVMYVSIHCSDKAVGELLANHFIQSVRNHPNWDFDKVKFYIKEETDASTDKTR